VIQEGTPEIVHEQPALVVSATLPLPPLEANEAFEADRLYVHGAGASLTM
jgi:hypothetical protein